MGKAKPIEPGCRVMVVRGPKAGLQGTAKERVIARQVDADRFLPAWLLIDVPVGIEGFLENHLIRIDDPDIQTQIDRERVLENV